MKHDNPPRAGAEPWAVMTNRQSHGSTRRLPPLLSCAFCASSRPSLMRGPPRPRLIQTAARQTNQRIRREKTHDTQRQGETGQPTASWHRALGGHHQPATPWLNWWAASPAFLRFLRLLAAKPHATNPSAKGAKKRKRRKNKMKHDNPPRAGAEPWAVMTNRQTPGSTRRLPPLLSCAFCASSRPSLMQQIPPQKGRKNARHAKTR